MRPQIDNKNDAAKRPTKFVGGAGHFAARLVHEVVKPLLAKVDRLVFALDELKLLGEEGASKAATRSLSSVFASRKSLGVSLRLSPLQVGVV